MIVNFVLIAGVILWAARKYVPGMLRDRTAAIQRCDAGGAEGQPRSAAEAGRD